jgi:hypothetical protein
MKRTYAAATIRHAVCTPFDDDLEARPFEYIPYLVHINALLEPEAKRHADLHLGWL